MRLTREGSRRFYGTTDIIFSKPSEIKDLSLIFNNVTDFNSRTTHHDYTLKFSDEELDQLWEERQKRILREILAGAVVLENADGNPADKKYLLKLLDQRLEQDRDRLLFGLRLGG